MTSSPINLHTHGAHISPKGNADNVLLHIPPGMSNTYTYDIPRNMPQGAVLVSQPSSWAHFGAGLYRARRPACHRTNGRQPAARHGEQHSHSEHGASVQFRLRPCRRSGATQQSDLAAVGQLHNAAEGRTSWRTGPTVHRSRRLTSTDRSRERSTSRSGMRGRFQSTIRRGQPPVHPQQSAALHRGGRQSDSDVPADPSLPDYKRDVQFTVNGQFQPVIKSKAGQTEIWVLANVSDFAYMNVQLTETATGRHPPIAIVGQDGNPYTSRPLSADGQRHAAAHSTGEPVRDCSDDTSRRRARSRDAGARRRCKDDHRARRALHQQWNRQSSSRAGEPERPALGRQLCRRVLRLSNPGAGESHALGRSRRDDRLHRRSVARCLHVLCRPRQHARRTSSGRS